MTTLVIAAHPDDEVLGCGGTIARMAETGEDVHIAILGEGLTSRFDRREDADTQCMADLRDASQRAADLLGASSVRNLSLPDNRFDTVPLLEVIKLIESLVEEYRPHTVFTQHGGDLNNDHTITFRATLTATRPMAGCPVKTVYAYEVASSTEWAFGRFHPRFEAQVFVDIQTTLDRKIQAMQTYDSEARPFPHPRSPEALRAIATRRGSQVGMPAAEVFSLVRELKSW
jgi:LmbE family N-acetylglucosaminyl deacetylase